MAVRLRFRSDVPVGINLSGGLDSSALLGAVQLVQGADSDIKAFTYVTGEPNTTNSRGCGPCWNAPTIPSKCASSVRTRSPRWPSVFRHAPTSRLAVYRPSCTRSCSIKLARPGSSSSSTAREWTNSGQATITMPPTRASPCDSSRVPPTAPVRPECLTEEFRALAAPMSPIARFSDRLRNLQYRDIRHTKMPKALRFNDRASMRVSTELREPFLDHRLFELALRQPECRKVRQGTHKWLLRELARRWLPTPVVEAPKRAVSTPQREWLRGPLKSWVEGNIADGLHAVGGPWLDASAVWRAWDEYSRGGTDNSFFVWQWVSIGLISRAGAPSINQARLRADARVPNDHHKLGSTSRVL